MRGCTRMILFLLMVMPFAFFVGCGDDDDNNGNGNLNGDYLILAYIGEQVDGFTADIERMDSTATPCNQITISVNGTQATRLPTSTADYSDYVLLDIDYTEGTQMNIVVNAGGQTATCSFTAPSYPWPDITSPVDGSTFVTGSTMNIVWEYNSNPPESVHLGVDEQATSGELYQGDFVGTTTSHSIPGSTTAAWNVYPSIVVTVDCGSDAWFFTGDIAFLGSCVTMLFAGAANTIFTSDTADTGTHGDTDYVVSVELSDYSISADGSSSTNATVYVEDEYGTPVDGENVTFSAQPTGRVTINPATMALSGGYATTVVTALTTPGDVNIYASYSGFSGFATLSLEEHIEFAITVGAGAHPQISWTPDSTFFGLVVRKEGVTIGNTKWILGSVLGFSSPVTYGTVPSGATQAFPLAGAPPDTIEIGPDYLLGLITQYGDTAFQEFSR